MTSQDNGSQNTKSYRGWKIRPRLKGHWQIDNARNSNRIRSVQPSLEKAKQEIDRRVTQEENLGLLGGVLADRLRIEIATALSSLNGYVSITDLVNCWKQHHPDAGEKPLDENAYSPKENPSSCNAHAKPAVATRQPSYDSSKYLRANEACAYCHISRRTLSRWQETGLVDFSRVGRRMVLFKRSSLDKMLESLTINSIKLV